MKDYNQFPYSKLLKAVESGCQQYGIEGDFVKRLLSMNDAISIDYLIKAYNNIIKILSISNYKSTKVPNLWYQIDHWNFEYQNLYYDLNQYLNECILLWFIKQNKPTHIHFRNAICNLRYSDNADTIQADMSKYYHVDNEKIQTYYCAIRKQHHYFLKMINQKGIINKDYSIYRKNYIFYSNSLSIDGHIFDIIENEFAKHHEINYIQELSLYKKALERKKELEKEEEKKKKREKKQKESEVFNDAVNSVGEVMLSGLLSMPFGLFGGIISNMKKRR